MHTLCASIALFLGTAIQQAAATGWLDAQVFKAPFSIDNVCDEHQKKGYDFTDLAIGAFSIYGGADFSGFTCANSFDKRDLLTSRTFNSKCIKGKATKDYNNSPKISCGKDQKDMSIKHMDVSTSVDTDLEFHYGYENGQTCKQIAPCKKGGSTIENNQCGGAISVTVKLPEKDQKSDCEVGIHKVNFDCSPPSQPPPKPIPTPTPSESKPVEITKPVESKPPIYTTPYANSSTPHSSLGTAPPYTPTTSIYIPPPSSPPVYTTPSPSFPTTTAANSSTPAPSIPTTTVPVYTTEVTHVTVTTCPVTTSVTSGTSTSVVTTSKVSTIYITSTSTVCTQCIPQPITPTAAPPTSPPAPPPAPESSSPIPAPVSSSAIPPPPPPPPPPATCPPVLPGCMKTWVPKTTCVDNADTNCLCKHADFTKYVYECVSAWGADEGEITNAISNFAGLCAPQLPENPCIVTGVPPSFNLTPPGYPPAGGSPALTGGAPVPVPGTPAPAPTVTGTPGNSLVGVSPPSYAPAGQPVTTLNLNTTLPAPCPAVTQAADGQPVVPLSSGCSTVINTQVVVPQVHITTGVPAPGASGSNVGLAAGSPPAVPAYQTPAPGAPGNSPYVPTTLGTAVGSASIVGSVQPPGPTNPIAFAGDAHSLKATTFSIFAGFVAILVLA
ncbi:MAG: hypothetical protein LQ342_000107 [Letrouitia transgressa]|nr:MAG: hypothetical protein LQ342_000107 [Letrouitia transgressa]